MHNSHEELTESRPEGECLMVKNNKGRKTTLDERIAIVGHCTANANNYALTAKEFHCSYRQGLFLDKKRDRKDFSTRTLQ